MNITRRQILQSTGLTLAAGTIAMAKPLAATERKRLLRVAHLTDLHLEPECGGDIGVATCLQHVQANHAPDLVLFGGDIVFDVSGTQPERTKSLADLWKRTIKNELSTLAASCIGNHDIPNLKEQTDANECKKWACDLLEMPRRYHSFDSRGWHFIMLDSVQPGAPFDYEGRIDPEQFAWLENDLRDTPATTPILIVSHMPIVSVTGFFEGEPVQDGNWKITRNMVHIDARELTDLFGKHPNVKLCLSGHAHLLDRVDYDGVTYLCNGAVCGGWWAGPNGRCDNGYGLVDLFDDGTFEHRYVTYGWKARE